MQAELQIKKVEEWRAIIGYAGLYEVSNLGRIKSLQRTKKNKWGGLIDVNERILSNGLHSQGYINVLLYKKGKRKLFLAHRIVAHAFLPNPSEKPHINHIDGDKSNNSIDNLEWCTVKENNVHAYSSGIKKAANGENTGAAKLTESQVVEIRSLRNSNSLIELAKRFNVSFQLISLICNYKIWKHI